MAITKLTTDMDIIAALPDEPNETGGYTATELKAKFDEAGNIIKDYVNDTLIPDVEAEITAGGSMSVLIDKIYPVGSIYMSMASTSPSTLFGGTWEAITGKFLLSASDDHEVGSTGGEETHALTVSEMPAHSHSTAQAVLHGNSSNTGNYKPAATTWSAKDSNMGISVVSTTSVGGGEAHNNMPPYLTVYMWKRTA